MSMPTGLNADAKHDSNTLGDTLATSIAWRLKLREPSPDTLPHGHRIDAYVTTGRIARGNDRRGN